MTTRRHDGFEPDGLPSRRRRRTAMSKPMSADNNMLRCPEPPTPWSVWPGNGQGEIMAAIMKDSSFTGEICGTPTPPS
jgi:hypothetical protein